MFEHVSVQGAILATMHDSGHRGVVMLGRLVHPALEIKNELGYGFHSVLNKTGVFLKVIFFFVFDIV